MNLHSSSVNWSEVVGGKIIELLSYEPDPNSSHDCFYYNTAENKLYRLDDVIDPCSNTTSKVWTHICKNEC